MKKQFLALLLALAMLAMAGCAVALAEPEATAEPEVTESTPSAAPAATPAVSAAPAADAPADPTINVENAAYWREILQKYRADDAVQQLLLVRYTEGCTAKAYFYEKIPAENNAWTLVFEEDDAIVGKYGIDKTQEGDAKTPTGDFAVTGAFGIRKNPGTALNYLPVQENTYACDEAGQYYNQIIDAVETGHQCKGEAMYTLSPEYNYGMTTDYNANNTAGLGSAIFLHCKGAKGFTGGCVAFDEEHMVTMLQKATAMRVVIGLD